MAFKHIVQYCYKRKQGWHQEAEILDPKENPLKKQITQAIMSKFMLTNQDKIVKFKNTLAEEVKSFVEASKAMSFPNKPQDFTALFDEYQERFFNEFKEANLKIFEITTKKYVDAMVAMESLGHDFVNKEYQNKLIEKAVQESDDLALANYEQMSA